MRGVREIGSMMNLGTQCEAKKKKQDKPVCEQLNRIERKDPDCKEGNMEKGKMNCLEGQNWRHAPVTMRITIEVVRDTMAQETSQ